MATSSDNNENQSLGTFELELLSYLGLYMPQAHTALSSRSTTAASSPNNSGNNSRASSPTARSDYPPSNADQGAAHIAVLANGCRGDIEPMVSLAHYLMGQGHRVRILTNANFVDFCLQRGIDAMPTFSDTEWVLHKMGGLSGVGTEAIRNGQREAMEFVQTWETEHPAGVVPPNDALKEFHADIAICGCQAVQPGLAYEQITGVPAVMVHVSPESLELNGYMDNLKPTRPSFYAVSEFYDHRPVMKHITRTGPWFYEEGPTLAEISKGGHLCELHSFLKQRKPPIVAVGWGSMFPRSMSTLDMLWLALTALSMAKRRGVILGGWARLDELGHQLVDGKLTGLGSKWNGLAEFAADHVYFINAAPHKWLLPYCSCIIHHGGVGTAHTALRSGTPAVVTPIFADEFETSERIRSLSAGVGFEQALPEITPKELAHAITRAERMTDNVIAGSVAMRREDGALKAAHDIEEFLQREVLSGEWRRQHAREEEKRQVSQNTEL